MKKKIYTCDICGEEIGDKYALKYILERPIIKRSEYSYAFDGLDVRKLDICSACWHDLSIKKEMPKKILIGVYGASKCPVCYNILDKEYSYCPNCGQKLNYNK